jgi:hypothetical protein
VYVETTNWRVAFNPVSACSTDEAYILPGIGIYKLFEPGAVLPFWVDTIAHIDSAISFRATGIAVPDTFCITDMFRRDVE